jgi:hypothetical protein
MYVNNCWDGGTGNIEQGRGKREEGRGKREEGRGKREEGRGKREEGRRKREEGRLKYSVETRKSLLENGIIVKLEEIERKGTSVELLTYSSLCIL